MKALQITGPRQFRIVEAPVPSIGEHEVLVQIKGCNTCTQWDLTIWRGVDIFERDGYPRYPLELGATGHELAGVVSRVGRNVTLLREGDHVALWGSPRGVQSSYQGGGYAEYFVAHERSLLPFPDAVPFHEAALLELLTCLTTTILRAGEVVGERVGVSGMGPAGLLAVQALKARGAREVIGFDMDPARLELARRLGADRVMQADTPEWQELTAREANLPLSIDCIGVAASVNKLLKVTSKRVLLFGVPHGQIDFGIAEWVKGLTLEGYGSRSEEGAHYARHLLVSGQVKAAPLVTTSMPLEEYDRGVGLLDRKEAIKVFFTP
jgi:threonine dehydrogenase-like Zn-dependent dehydrogenase